MVVLGKIARENVLLQIKEKESEVEILKEEVKQSLKE